MTGSSSTTPSRLHRFLLLLLTLPFPIMGITYALRHRTQVPLMDLLYFNLPLAVTISRGENVWALLFSPFNGPHIHVSGGLLTIINTSLTDWNPQNEQAALLVLLGLNYSLLLRLLWGSGRHIFWGSLLPVSAFFWTVTQDASSYVGIHTTWLFVNLSLLVALVMLEEGPPRLWRLIVAGFAGLWATFSLFNGMVLFVAMAPIVLLRYRARRFLWAWAGMTLGTWALLFFLLLRGGGFSTGMSTVETTPSTLFLFGPMLLGSGFSIFFFRYASAFIFGMLILGWLMLNGIILWRAGEHNLLRRWGSMAAFILMGAGLITLGRYQAGLLTSQSLHYNALVKYLWIVLAVSVVAVLPHLQRAWVRRGMAVLGVTLFVVHLWSSLEVWYGKQWYNPQTIAGYEQCLDAYPTTGETACLDRLVLLELDQVVALVDEMYELRVGYYRDWP